MNCPDFAIFAYKNEEAGKEVDGEARKEADGVAGTEAGKEVDGELDEELMDKVV
jgi:hypothetical protein